MNLCTLHRAGMAMLLLLACNADLLGQSEQVAGSKRPKVFMHMMPWFDTPEVLGPNHWGIHWTMANQDPNIVDPTGKRQIASHYYPKIGPYQSSNAHVVEYHLLLMKLSGVDGILLDWYGIQGTNGDIDRLLSNSNAIIDRVGEFGLEFAVKLEDRFWTTTHGSGIPDINKAKVNMGYVRDHYLNQPEYIRIGANNNPLLTVFGPITFEKPAQWTEILAEAGQDVEFLTLWYESQEAGVHASGEYAWIYQDANTNNHLSHVANFYRFRAPQLDMAGGVAYPGFVDFYDEGGWTGIPFTIPHASGQTLANTLNLAELHGDNLDFVQLATWNDFGEGTMFEPTLETGFNYLVQLQKFTGTDHSENDLRLVYQLYMARQKYTANPAIQQSLDQVAELLAESQVSAAAELLDSVAPRGDFDGDGDVDLDDYNVFVDTFNQQYSLYGTGADGNFDGIVDIADFTIWRDSYQLYQSVPEPAGWLLTLPICLLRNLERKLTHWAVPKRYATAAR